MNFVQVKWNQEHPSIKHRQHKLARPTIQSLSQATSLYNKVALPHAGAIVQWLGDKTSVKVSPILEGIYSCRSSGHGDNGSQPVEGHCSPFVSHEQKEAEKNICLSSHVGFICCVTSCEM